MTKTMTIMSMGGFDNFLKISSTLKRRRFTVDRINLESIDQHHFCLDVTLSGDDATFNQAIRFMKKNEDVYEIIEKTEE
jgi:acetolactate synthase small subunit